jgi:hypothetical protein
MAMTKKDYQLIADCFKQQLSEIHAQGGVASIRADAIERCAERLAQKLSATQDNFQIEPFLAVVRS